MRGVGVSAHGGPEHQAGPAHGAAMAGATAARRDGAIGRGGVCRGHGHAAPSATSLMPASTVVGNSQGERSMRRGDSAAVLAPASARRAEGRGRGETRAPLRSLHDGEARAWLTLARATAERGDGGTAKLQQLQWRRHFDLGF